MSTVSANGSTSFGVRTLTTAGLIAVVGALVLGILAMHGLSQHGAATPAAQPVAAVGVDPHANHPTPDHQPAAADSTAQPGGDAQPGSSSDEHGSMTDTVMMCVAMLLAAAVTLLLTLALVRSAHRAPSSLMPALRVLAFADTARAGTGPPAVWEFSVVRC